MARITHKTTAPDYVAMRNASARFNEANDCAVVAVAVACNVTYEEAHRELAKAGRRRRDGTRFHQTQAAVNALGYKMIAVFPRDFIAQYPKAHRKLKSVTTHHPDRFNKVWADGNVYLFQTDRHILAVKDGVNCDWTRGRAMRCRAIHKVVSKATAPVTEAEVGNAALELIGYCEEHPHIHMFRIGQLWAKARGDSADVMPAACIQQLITSLREESRRLQNLGGELDTRLDKLEALHNAHVLNQPLSS